jgi:hypothetical protein
MNQKSGKDLQKINAGGIAGEKTIDETPGL